MSFFPVEGVTVVVNVCVAGNDLRSCRFIAFLCSVIRVSIFLEVWPIYLCGQSFDLSI